MLCLYLYIFVYATVYPCIRSSVLISVCVCVWIILAFLMYNYILYTIDAISSLPLLATLISFLSLSILDISLFSSLLFSSLIPSHFLPFSSVWTLRHDGCILSPPYELQRGRPACVCEGSPYTASVKSSYVFLALSLLSSFVPVLPILFCIKRPGPHGNVPRANSM